MFFPVALLFANSAAIAVMWKIKAGQNGTKRDKTRQF